MHVYSNQLLPALLILLLSLSGCGGGGEGGSSRVNGSSSGIKSIDITVVPMDEVRTYQVETDGSAATNYQVTPYKDWITINSSGLITFNPATSNAGQHTFKVTAESYGEVLESNSVNVTVKAINTTIATDYTDAPDIEVESVVTPIINTRYDGMHMVPNADGESWDLLMVYMKTYGGPNEIVIIDTGTHEIKHVKQSTYMQWHLGGSVVAPDGKLYIASIVRPGLSTAINIYDPVTNTLELDAIPLPETLGGETNPIVLGTDGMIYVGSGGSDSRAQIVQIDPTTRVVTDYGNVGESHSPSGVWGYSACADDDYAYVVSGKIPWYIVGVNKSTGEQITFLTQDEYIALIQTEFGCYAHSSYTGLTHFLYQGQITERINWAAPPWPIPAYRAGEDTLIADRRTIVDLPPKPEVITTNAKPDVNSAAEVWVKYAGADWQSFSYTLEGFAQTISRIFTVSDGRIFGTGRTYTGFFMYDPKTDNVEVTGLQTISHYATAEHNGSLYMSGYPNSITYAYDLSKEWTQEATRWSPTSTPLAGNNSAQNPRFIDYLNKGTVREGSGVHAVKSSVVGADGLIYIAGEWRRNGKGGGLEWYNPEDDSYDGISEIFSNYRVENMVVVNSGKQIILSTKGVRDDVLSKPTPTEGRIFVFDVATKQITNSFDPLPESITTGEIVASDGPYILGLSTVQETVPFRKDSYFYRLNTESGELDYKITLNYESLFGVGDMYSNGAMGPKGRYWTYLGRKLTTIDPFSGEVTVVGKLKKEGVNQYGGFAFSGDDLYLNYSSSLRRAVGVAQ
jgi:hypothetical protein